jgi:octaprenyl-diphosphate synthase
MKLGTAYQSYDDCLDLVGSEATVGKTLRTDLEKGKLTLPILNLLETANPGQRDKLNRRIIEQQPLDLPVLLGIAEYEGAVERAIDTAAAMVGDCRKILTFVPPSDHRDALERITRYLDGLLDQCRR